MNGLFNNFSVSGFPHLKKNFHYVKNKFYTADFQAERVNNASAFTPSLKPAKTEVKGFLFPKGQTHKDEKRIKDK